MLRALLASLFLTAPALTPGEATEDVAPSVAWIVANEEGGVATLDVYADFPQAGGGRYSLSIEKRGPNGRSSTTQAGTLPNRASGVARIAHNTHSLAESEHLVAVFAFTATDGTKRHEEVTLGMPGK